MCQYKYKIVWCKNWCWELFNKYVQCEYPWIMSFSLESSFVLLALGWHFIEKYAGTWSYGVVCYQEHSHWTFIFHFLVIFRQCSHSIVSLTILKCSISFYMIQHEALLYRIVFPCSFTNYGTRLIYKGFFSMLFSHLSYYENWYENLNPVEDLLLSNL